MDLFKSMDSFVRVARTGSFTLAAAQIGASRAIVSKHVKDLEDHLRARLLYRTTRRLSLTEIGLKHYAFCARILEELEVEHEEATLLQREPRGEIRLMAPKSFGNQFLAPIVAEFVERHEGIKISMLLSDDSPAGLNLIENGVDLAIRLSESSALSMVGRRIGSLNWLLCAAPEFLAKAGMPRKPKDLERFDCLLHLKYLPEGEWQFTRAGRTVAVKVAGRFAANSSLAVRAAALRGLGIALLPAYCVEDDLADGSLTDVLPGYRLPAQPIFAFYPHQRLVTAKVRLLLDFFVERFADPVTDGKMARSARSSA
jgi:DNA-binding transcriptional LysR family regulator